MISSLCLEGFLEEDALHLRDLEFFIQKGESPLSRLEFWIFFQESPYPNRKHAVGIELEFFVQEDRLGLSERDSES